MKNVNIFCLILMAIGLVFPVQASAIGEQTREVPAVSREFVEESSMSLQDDDAELFLELEILDSFVNDESELGEFEEFLGAHASDELSTIPVEVSWKWGVTNLKLNQDNMGVPPSDQQRQTFNSRFDPARIGVQEDQYVAAAELSGAVANVEVYTEFGIAGGKVSNFEENALMDRELEEAIELDLGTYYMAGGASMGLGHWKLGLEAGYGSGANSSSSSPQSFSGTPQSSQLIGGQQVSSNSSFTSTRAPSLEDDPFKLVYFQGTANRNVTKNIGLNVGAVCFAVPEEFIENFEGKDMSAYGLELFGDVNYQLTKSFKYSLYMDYSLTDENFEREDIYQILNKLEFNF
ncbi:MAG: hypothetical protein GY801_16800 [bacterium]|nr:hypothetical protein [bacterium]